MTTAKIHIEVLHEGSHCIPCEYMASVVEFVAMDFTDTVHWEKVITKEHRGAMRHAEISIELGRQAPVPSIVIDGVLVFDAIPGPDVLREYLLKCLAEKQGSGVGCLATVLNP